jgi:hypothetical protein
LIGQGEEGGEYLNLIEKGIWDPKQLWLASPELLVGCLGKARAQQLECPAGLIEINRPRGRNAEAKLALLGDVRVQRF